MCRLACQLPLAAPRANSSTGNQLFEGASSVESNITEGFARFVPGEFRTFLRYSLASLAEAVVRVRDGADRGHFTAEATTKALRLGELCRQSTQNLRASLRRNQ